MIQLRLPIANCRFWSRILAPIVFAVGASAFAVEALARVGGGQSYGGGGGSGGGGGGGGIGALIYLLVSTRRIASLREDINAPATKSATTSKGTQ